MKYFLLSAMLLCFVSTALANEAEKPAGASVSLGINGVWRVESGNGQVEVKDCGDGTPCGTLIWINETHGSSTLDANNQDPSLRQRPLIGSPVFWGFKKKGDTWKSGYIYDAESGKTYKSKMKLKNGDLIVKGCVGPICQSQSWVRVSP